MSIEFLPLKNIGLEVKGLDPDHLSDPETRKALYDAWLEHGVLLFRGIGKNTDIHRAVSRCFGPLEEEEVLTSLRVEGEKGIISITKAGRPMIPSYFVDGKLLTGVIFWHQDLIFTPKICKGGILRMLEAAEVGGETGWVDTIKVYDSLSDEMKQRIEKLEVRHRFRVDLTGIPFGLPPSLRQATQEEAPYDPAVMPECPDVVHPLVSVHPETGRKSLGISPQTLVEVIGMDKRESDELLSGLVEYALRDEFKMIHRWEKDDMVLWDNRRTIHAGLGYPPDQRRVAQRTTLAGGMMSGRIYEEAA